MSKQGVIILWYYFSFLDIDLLVTKKKSVKLHQLQKINTVCHFRITHDTYLLKNAFISAVGQCNFLSPNLL